MLIVIKFNLQFIVEVTGPGRGNGSLKSYKSRLSSLGTFRCFFIRTRQCGGKGNSKPSKYLQAFPYISMTFCDILCLFRWVWLSRYLFSGPQEEGSQKTKVLSYPDSLCDKGQITSHL